MNELISAFEKGDIAKARTIQVPSVSFLFSPTSLWYFCHFCYWHRCLISMSSSKCKSFSVLPWNLVSKDVILPKDIIALQKLFLRLCINCFILIDRLWSGGEQTADVCGVRLVSRAPSTPSDAVFWRSCSVHRRETSETLSWTLICSRWIVEPWKSLNNPTRLPISSSKSYC